MGALAIAVAASLTGCSGSDPGDAAASTTATQASSSPAPAPVSDSRPASPDAGPTRRVTCAEAFLVEPAPRASRSGADTVGAVRFVGVADGRRRADLVEPSATHDYWAYKTPLEVTLGPRTQVTISSRAGRILIGRATTGTLARSLGDLPRRVIIVPCPSRSEGGRHVASFPGGFAFERPGCVDVTVRTGDRMPRTRAFPLGVASC